MRAGFVLVLILHILDLRIVDLAGCIVFSCPGLCIRAFTFRDLKREHVFCGQLAAFDGLRAGKGNVVLRFIGVLEVKCRGVVACSHIQCPVAVIADGHRHRVLVRINCDAVAVRRGLFDRVRMHAAVILFFI